jgi:hypothetical protein
MPSVRGRPLHTRSLTIVISRKSDTLWHARGDVIDLRKHGFVPMIDDIQPSGVIHMMSIELDFDPKSLRIEQIAVDQPFIAIEASEASGGECCRDPVSRLQALRGDEMDAGFSKRLAGQFGGALGCSHLLTLFQLMASTLPRVVELETTRALREKTSPPLGKCFFRRSVFVDGHEQSDKAIDVAIQLADTHSRPIQPGDRATERLELSHEVKAFICIDRKRFKIESLEARERQRGHATLGRADWILHTDRVAELIGAPLIPGMAGRIFRLLDDEASLRPLRDLLLQLAPGFIQITAALMDEYFEKRESSSAADSTDRSNDKPVSKPAVASFGGNTNSCYMWREDGRAVKAWATDTTDSNPN